MLKKSDDVIRFYIINTQCLDSVFFTKRRSRILYTRPSRWRVFLQGFLRLNDDLCFVRLPDSVVNRFIDGQVAARKINNEFLKINAHTVRLEKWTFWNMLKFCAEGVQYGTFQRFWEWIW